MFDWRETAPIKGDSAEALNKPYKAKSTKLCGPPQVRSVKRFLMFKYLEK